MIKNSFLCKIMIKAVLVLAVAIIGCVMITGKLPKDIINASRENNTSFGTEFINAAMENSGLDISENIVDDFLSGMDM